MTDTQDVSGADVPATVEEVIVETPEAIESGDTIPETTEEQKPADSPEEDTRKSGYQRTKEKAEREAKRADEEARKAFELDLKIRQKDLELQAALDELNKLKTPELKPLGKMPVLFEDGIDTVEQFQEAMSKYAREEAKHIAAQELESARTRQSEETAKAAYEKTVTTINYRINEVATKNPDFWQVVNPYAGILANNPAIEQYVAENASKDATPLELVYHLCKNPAMLKEVTELPLGAGILRISELEKRLKAPPPTKQITKAPDPITPVGAHATVQKSLADYARNEDISDFVAASRKG